MNLCRKLYQLATAVVLLSMCAFANAQLSNGVYSITSKLSGKPIEITGASKAAGANVIQWANNGGDHQKWIVTNEGNGYYSIINLLSGMALEVFDFSTADGGNVVQYDFWHGDPQLWTLSSQGNGYYAVLNKHSGKALDLYGFDTSNGANIAQWAFWGGDPQQWQFTKIANVGAAPVDTSTINGATNHWPLTGNLVTHDPTMAYENGSWWLYQTGEGIYGKYSANGLAWDGLPSVFPNGLSWWKTYVPGQSNNDVWAPDVRTYNGRVYLYYSISTFGSRVSAIGLASASSLAASDWQDHGLVINTTSSSDWNAIDPDLVVDEHGNPWLTMGSWNSGIKVMRLNPITMKPIGTLYSIAQKGGGIEAPSIVYRRGYYYLFVSIGKCCAGVDSTYQIAYGRSTSITGPYLDKNGNDMMNGGGSILDAGNNVWVGPGGQDIINTDVIVRHAYDATDAGIPKMIISTLNWDANGWPKY